MKIGEVSKQTGVSIRMLRYYEQEGLLNPRRLASGYRDYGLSEVGIVNCIRMLSGAGLKLDFIHRFLPCITSDPDWTPDFHLCPDLLAALKHEVNAIQQHILMLQASQRTLSGYLERALVSAGHTQTS